MVKGWSEWEKAITADSAPGWFHTNKAGESSRFTYRVACIATESERNDGSGDARGTAAAGTANQMGMGFIPWIIGDALMAGGAGTAHG